MEPTIDLAPGAEDNVLAVELAERIRENLAAHRDKVADLRALRATVLIVAQDAGESLTLRFDDGRVTVHDGSVGVPWVTFCGDADALRRLPDFPLTPRLRLPLLRPFSGDGRDTFWSLTGLWLRGDIKVYGLLSHPRTVFRLLRVLSVHD